MATDRAPLDQSNLSTKPEPGATLHTKAHDPSFVLRDWLILCGVVGLALAIRLIYIHQFRDCPYFWTETMDAAFHDEWAKAIAAGTPFVHGAYFRAPLYPWFLGLLYKLTDVNYVLVRSTQVVLGSLSCGLLYVIGRRVFDRSVATVAAAACSTYWLLVYFDSELLIPVLVVFLDLVLIWRLLLVGERRTPFRCAMAGLTLGLSAIARPNILLFAPPVCLWILMAKPRWKAGVIGVAAFGSWAIIPILPVTVHNLRAGDHILIASQAGVNFFIGNNAEADGMRVHLPGLPPTIEAIQNDTVKLAENEAGHALRPSQVSSYYFGKALDFMRAQPLAAMSLMLHKLGYFWTYQEILNNKHIHFLTQRYAPVIRYLPLGFYAVGPLGILGLAACAGRARELFPLWGFVVVYMLSVVAFFVTARFRVPVLPVLMLLGAHGVQAYAGAIRLKQWRRVAALSAVLALGTWVVSRPAHPPGMDRRPETSLANLATVLHRDGRSWEAIALLEESVAIKPHYAKALYSLGVTYAAVDRMDEAQLSYERAIAADPGHVGARNNLAMIYIDRHRYDDAILLLRRAIELDPAHAAAHFNLGQALDEQGHYQEAVDVLRVGLRLDPDRLEVWFRMIDLLRKLDRFVEAAESLEQALTIDPENVEILIQLCQIRSAIDDAAVLDGVRARSAGEKAVRLTDRQDALALDALAAAYAECERWNQAVGTAEEAVHVADSQNQLKVAKDIGNRRDMYARGQKFRVGQP